MRSNLVIDFDRHRLARAAGFTDDDYRMLVDALLDDLERGYSLRDSFNDGVAILTGAFEPKVVRSVVRLALRCAVDRFEEQRSRRAVFEEAQRQGIVAMVRRGFTVTRDPNGIRARRTCNAPKVSVIRPRARTRQRRVHRPRKAQSSRDGPGDGGGEPEPPLAAFAHCFGGPPSSALLARLARKSPEQATQFWRDVQRVAATTRAVRP